MNLVPTNGQLQLPIVSFEGVRERLELGLEAELAGDDVLSQFSVPFFVFN